MMEAPQQNCIDMKWTLLRCIATKWHDVVVRAMDHLVARHKLPSHTLTVDYNRTCIFYRAAWCHLCCGRPGWDYHVTRNALPSHRYREQCTAQPPQDMWMVCNTKMIKKQHSVDIIEKCTHSEQYTSPTFKPRSHFIQVVPNFNQLELSHYQVTFHSTEAGYCFALCSGHLSYSGIAFCRISQLLLMLGLWN